MHDLHGIGRALLPLPFHCKDVPAEASASGLEGIQQMRDGWGELATMTPEQRSEAAASCRDGMVKLRDASASTGCPI